MQDYLLNKLYFIDKNNFICVENQNIVASGNWLRLVSTTLLDITGTDSVLFVSPDDALK